MNMLIEGIGIVGAVAILLGYFQVSRGRWSPHGLAYQLSNVIGALLLIWYGFEKLAFANILINFVWLVIGVLAIIAMIRSNRRPKKSRSHPRA